MRKLIFFAILIFAIAVVFLLLNANRKTTPVSKVKKETAGTVSSNMKITSTVFANNSKIPFKYTCDGENINPPLSFIDIPQNAKSLTLIMDDPDAPMGTWVHWIVFNIDPKTNAISENSKPEGTVEGMTSFGNIGYGGPCPHKGTHRYFFKLYALDTMLSLSQKSIEQELEQAMQGHILDKAELVGLYTR